MTVEELRDKLNLEAVNEADLSRNIESGYVGDLLSRVMGCAKSEDVWITIMTNKNILAVASLTDVSSIIIAENAEIDVELKKTAKQQEINLYRSSETAFKLCGKISELLDE